LVTWLSRHRSPRFAHLSYCYCHSMAVGSVLRGSKLLSAVLSA
jgi:hypothetical protein